MRGARCRFGAATNQFLIRKEIQPQTARARFTLTVALSREPDWDRDRDREHGDALSRVLVGEGWGRSRAFEPHAASLRSGPGLQARTRTASEGDPQTV